MLKKAIKKKTEEWSGAWMVSIQFVWISNVFFLYISTFLCILEMGVPKDQLYYYKKIDW